MGDLILEATVLGLALIALLASWFRKQELKSRLFDSVSWCVVEDKLNECVNSRHLLHHIGHICWNSVETSGIDKNHCIGRDSEEFALDILDSYRAYLTEFYFKGNLKIECAKLSRDEYFMLTLCNYLEKCEYSITFNENTMYRKLERTSQETAWGTTLYTTTYELTPYGATYNKLLLIARTYCENNKHINDKQAMSRRSNDIRDRLDSNRITM